MEDQITNNVVNCLSNMRRSLSLPSPMTTGSNSWIHNSTMSDFSSSVTNVNFTGERLAMIQVESINGNRPRLPPIHCILPEKVYIPSGSFSPMADTSESSPRSCEETSLLESECCGLDPLMTLASVSVALSVYK